MSNTLCAPDKTPRTFTFNEFELKGIDQLAVDDNVTIVIKARVVRVGRDTYDKKKPFEITVEHISSKQKNVRADIESADNIKDLDKAGKHIESDGGDE